MNITMRFKSQLAYVIIIVWCTVFSSLAMQVQMQEQQLPDYVRFKLEGQKHHYYPTLKMDDARITFPYIQDVLDSPLERKCEPYSVYPVGQEVGKTALVVSVPLVTQHSNGIKLRHVQQLCALAKPIVHHTFIHDTSDMYPLLNLIEAYQFKYEKNSSEIVQQAQQFQENLYELAEETGLASHIYQHFLSE